MATITADKTSVASGETVRFTVGSLGAGETVGLESDSGTDYDGELVRRSDGVVDGSVTVTVGATDFFVRIAPTAGSLTQFDGTNFDWVAP